MQNDPVMFRFLSTQAEHLFTHAALLLLLLLLLSRSTAGLTSCEGTSESTLCSTFNERGHRLGHFLIGPKGGLCRLWQRYSDALLILLGKWPSCIAR